MHPDKCSGLDGYNPIFSKHLWNICSVDIVKDWRAWLDTGRFLAFLYFTNVALIPKGNSQTTMKTLTMSFYCFFVVQIWHLNRLWDMIQRAISDAIFHLLHELSSENSQNFSSTLCSLWKHTNVKLWQEIS